MEVVHVDGILSNLDAGLVRRTVRMAAYHVRRMELGFIHFTVDPAAQAKPGKSVPVHVVSPQFKMTGRMVVDARGRLLKFLQIYPGGKFIELRLEEE